MKRMLLISLLVCILFAAQSSRADIGASAAAAAQRVRPAVTMPFTFERNEGQATSEVKFLSRGSGRTAFFTEREIVLSLSKAAPAKPTRGAPRNTSREVIRIRFAGANVRPEITGDTPLAGTSNYFIGNDPSKWRRNIASYGRVRYRSLYPGIDAIFYGSQAGIEYDLIVSAGADPRKIRLSFDGVERLETDAHGDLILRTKTGDLVQRKPVVYQESPEGRCEIYGQYVRRGKREVTFELAAYDRSKPVVLDPELSWSTYLGGSDFDVPYTIAVDDVGSVYVTGYSQSSNFPTPNGIFPAFGGGFSDGFVAKFGPDGSIVYSTYLGGSDLELGQGIAVDQNHNVYVTGSTGSADFPTVNPIYPCGSCAFGIEDAFVTKLNAAGNALVYSTWLGGSDYDEGDSIAVDSSENAYVVGLTSSPDFPTVNPIQAAYGGGPLDAWVAKINATGSAITYSTYLGGSGEDWGLGLAMDTLGDVFVTGKTSSTNFPTVNPIQAANAGGFDAYVTEINATGDAVVYSSYLGGSGDDSSAGIVVDSSGDAYVVGATKSADFPTKNPLQAALGGGTDVFVTKIDPPGTHLVYSTYFGGSGDDGINKLRLPQSVSVDSAGDTYFAFDTASTDLPTVNALQTANAGTTDGFVAILNASANGLLLATYLGGTGIDYATSVGIDALSRPCVTGSTNSTDFPTKNAFQAANAGGYDVWVAKIAGPFALSMTPSSGPASGGTAVTISGIDFQSGATVTLGGNPATGVSVPTASEIDATTPALSPGTLNDVVVTNPDTTTATLPKGFLADFSDVPSTDPFYSFIVKLFRSGITGGCGGGGYCPANPVRRDQMAVFLLKGKHGSTYVPPPCTGIFPDVECAPTPAFAVNWIEQLFHEGVTGGCGGGNYCPGNSVTRAQMAVFLLKAEHGSSYTPPTCTGIFSDVECTPTPAFAVDWIERLFNEGITGGCGGGNYCPGNPVTRGQMAVFLVKTFGLQ